MLAHGRLRTQSRRQSGGLLKPSFDAADSATPHRSFAEQWNAAFMSSPLQRPVSLKSATLADVNVTLGARSGPTVEAGPSDQRQRQGSYSTSYSRRLGRRQLIHQQRRHRVRPGTWPGRGDFGIVFARAREPRTSCCAACGFGRLARDDLNQAGHRSAAMCRYDGCASAARAQKHFANRCLRRGSFGVLRANPHLEKDVQLIVFPTICTSSRKSATASS